MMEKALCRKGHMRDVRREEQRRGEERRQATCREGGRQARRMTCAGSRTKAFDKKDHMLFPILFINIHNRTPTQS